MKNIFLVLLSISSNLGLCNDSLRIDLSPAWRFESSLNPKWEGNGKVVRFTLPMNSSASLEIKHKRSFIVFVNDTFYAKCQDKVYWPVNELMSVGSPSLEIAIYSESGIQNLSTYLVERKSSQNFEKEVNTTSDVIVLASIALMAGLILLFKTSPQSTIEYFNIFKFLSIRNMDEGTLAARFTSANNVFIYLLCSAQVGLNIFIFLPYFNSNRSGVFNSPGFYLALIMGCVFFLLTGKIIIIKACSWLFRLAEFAPGQFLNFVRFLLISFSLSSVSLLLNFMMGGSILHISKLISVSMTGLMVVHVSITFIKLFARGGFTVFHLFSYLCASEIIPLVILLKVFIY